MIKNLGSRDAMRRGFTSVVDATVAGIHNAMDKSIRLGEIVEVAHRRYKVVPQTLATDEDKQALSIVDAHGHTVFVVADHTKKIRRGY